jgi:hypothetical protein
MTDMTKYVGPKCGDILNKLLDDEQDRKSVV